MGRTSVITFFPHLGKEKKRKINDPSVLACSNGQHEKSHCPPHHGYGGGGGGDSLLLQSSGGIFIVAKIGSIPRVGSNAGE